MLFDHARSVAPGGASGDPGQSRHDDGFEPGSGGAVADLAGDVASPAGAVPPSLRAHVWAPPAVIAVTPVSPGTKVGVARLVVEPSPIWPELLEPQQATVPACLSADVWLPPAAIEMGVFPQADRQRNTAIWARVTFWVGEEWPGEVPVVIPAASSHLTASSKYDPVGISKNP